jgi:hypothetical protein
MIPIQVRLIYFTAYTHSAWCVEYIGRYLILLFYVPCITQTSATMIRHIFRSFDALSSSMTNTPAKPARVFTNIVFLYLSFLPRFQSPPAFVWLFSVMLFAGLLCLWYDCTSSIRNTVQRNHISAAPISAALLMILSCSPMRTQDWHHLAVQDS